MDIESRKRRTESTPSSVVPDLHEIWEVAVTRFFGWHLSWRDAVAMGTRFMNRVELERQTNSRYCASQRAVRRAVDAEMRRANWSRQERRLASHRSGSR
jgi:hypothetical protein